MDGKCLTASWESAFRSVLLSSVASQLQNHVQLTDEGMAASVTETNAHLQSKNIRSNADTGEHDLEPILKPLHPVGKPCGACGKECVAFFRCKRGAGLVCRQCSIRKG